MTSDLKETVRLKQATTARLDEQREIRSRAFHPGGMVARFTEADVEQSIARRFEQQAAIYPDRAAIVTPAGRWTYRALNEQANRLARAILARRGEGPEPVALLLQDQVLTVTAMLAVLKAAKFYVTLDPEYPIGRLQQMMDDSGAGLVVTDGKNRVLAAELGAMTQAEAAYGDGDVTGPIMDVDRLGPPEPVRARNLDVDVTPDALAYIIYTSGSTGEPKGIVYDHRSVLAGIRNYTQAFHISPDDRLTLLHSMSFSSAMVDIYNALLNGATLYPWNVKTEGLAGLEGWLAREEVTIVDWVPSPFRYFADVLTGATDLPHLRLLVLASEPVTKRDVDLYRAHFAQTCILVNRLGTTETYNYRLYFVDHDTEIEGNLVPAGYGVADKVVEMRDPNGRDLHQPRGYSGAEVPPGEVGEITVRSRYLARGYWHRPDLTEERFRPATESEGHGGGVRVYWTGDLGVMHPDGLLEYHGRKDFQIKIRGFRIEPAEIETALTDLPGVRDAAVVARDGAGSGEKQLVAYVVPTREGSGSEGDSMLSASLLRRALMTRLPDYMVPSILITLDALPLTQSGKLDRRALPSPDSLPERGDRAGYLAPRDDLEQRLANAWQRILEVEHVGIRDNFFEMGGHSMAAVRVLVAIERDLGIKVSPPTFYRFPTIEQMADVLRGRETGRSLATSPLVTLHMPQSAGKNGTAGGSADARVSAGQSRPPFFVLPGNLGNVHTDLGHLAEFLGPDQPVYGLQDGPDVPARIPEMAELYVAEIRQLQPEGPYLLGGVCLGAVVAFEMAQQLKAQGEEVALLAMVEPARPWRIARGTRVRLRVEAYASFVRFLLTKALRRIRRGRRRNAPAAEGAGPGVGDARASGKRAQGGVEGVRVGLAWLRMKLKLVANVWALRHYAPTAYAGNVQIFMSDGSLGTAGAPRWDNPQLDWLHLIEGDRLIQDIPGNHDSITGDNRVVIEPAHMEVLAGKLRRAIDEALPGWKREGTSGSWLEVGRDCLDADTQRRGDEKTTERKDR